ncbi:hypothetical protein [Fusobacterium sp. PH5-44]|uniref:hypothetical protein n=1 Tax=unclassified Fusobacterium TaxID=2648384 RepID=UPI003D215C77
MRKIMVTLGILSLVMNVYGASSRKAVEKSNSTSFKAAKKVMHEKREDLFESLEEKVFRAPSTTKGKIQATDKAFDTGKKRMYYLQREEDQIRSLEGELGMEDVDHNFLTEKYDGVMEEFKTTKNEIEALEIENRKLKEYLNRLNTMESRAKGGRT